MTPTTARFPAHLPAAWREALAPEATAPYFRELTQFLLAEHGEGQTIYPPSELVLRALQTLDLPDVKVVILGQDPYHGPGQAIGLSFGVPNELRLKPPSLQNIFKEVESDLGVKLPPGASDLTGWAAQGVLLLNTVLTVRKAQAFSHREKGWETFTDQIIRKLNDRAAPLVFILWGAAAISKKKLLTNPAHRTLESPHPSPLSAHRGFLGSKVFSRANALLQSMDQRAIDWSRISA